MNYKIVIESYDTHIYFKISGKIALANVLGLQQYTHVDPYYIKTLRTLLDFREAVIIDEKAGRSVMKLGMKNLKDRPFVDPARVALLAGDEVIKKMGETYAGILKESPVDVRFFDDKQKALKWLRE